MSLPSAMVPKTTNRTAGHTPFPAFAKRKLDYSSTGKTVRKVSRKKLLSVSEINNQNKMFYHILPDGHAAFFSAGGYLEGPTGYWQPAIRACSEALSSEQSKYSDLVSRLNITTILPLRDLNTGQAKKLHYAGGTKSMDIKTIVFIYHSVKGLH